MPISPLTLPVDLPTTTPFLLLPVQLQVKFITTGNAASPHELWIRIYPDQIDVTTFESELTTSEITAGQNFWGAQAGDQDRLAAWRQLVAQFGNARAAWIAKQTNPASDPTPAGRDHAWTQPARAYCLPDYFVATLYQPRDLTQLSGLDPYLRNNFLEQVPDSVTDPIREYTTDFLEPVLQQAGQPLDPAYVAMGPNPSDTADFTDQASVQWMTDFEQAKEKGLGIVVPLTQQQMNQGFQRLVVLGVRSEGGDAAAGATRWQDVLTGHTYASHLAVLPLGTPTNNVDGAGTGYDSAADFDADAGYALHWGAPQYTATSERAAQADGQRLAASWGLPADTLTRIPQAGRNQRREAWLLNQALWPATYGYFLHERLRPWLSADAIEKTQQFFVDYVSGRGPLPAVRVHDVPYGVLPTTRYSTWQPSSSLGSWGADCWSVLRRLDATWTERLSQSINYPRRPELALPFAPEPPGRQNFLSVLGLEATSQEYYQRYTLGPLAATTLGQHALDMNSNIWPAITDPQNPASPPRQRAASDLPFGRADNPLYTLFRNSFDVSAPVVPYPHALNLPGSGWPRAFDETLQYHYTKVAHAYADQAPAQDQTIGQIIDGNPLSETHPVQALHAGGPNYIQWLATASFADVLYENFEAIGGVANEQYPNSLLYRLLRQAVLLRHWEAAVEFVRKLANAPSPALQEQEAEWFNVRYSSQHAQYRELARWEWLFRDDLAGTGGQALHHYLRGESTAGQPLREYLATLAALVPLPTAQLERALAEHLDLGAYRLDAWYTAHVAHRLEAMRASTPTGLFLGAFGWLEDLQADAESLVPPTTAPRHDPDNLGFVHAPSLTHGMTAAVLRQGFKSRESTAAAADPAANRMAVNLSSERVRRALGVLEGLRTGQELAELLGREGEDVLHAAPTNASYVYTLRDLFPQAAARHSANALTAADLTTASIPAAQRQRNVFDGLRLVETARAAGFAYPYGVRLPADPEAEAAIRTAVDAMADTLDALADLAVSESVHQIVTGNVEQGNAILDQAAKGQFPVSPDVVHPPRTGVSVTHRLLLQLPDVDAADAAVWGLPVTPRAAAEPALNQWLATRVGNPEETLFHYHVQPPTGPAEEGTLNLLELGLQPLDLLFLLERAALRPGSDLDLYLTRRITPLHPAGSQVRVLYAASTTVAPLALLLEQWRRLLSASRPAITQDFSALHAAAPGQEIDFTGFDRTEAAARINALRAGLISCTQALDSAITASTVPPVAGGTPSLTAAQVTVLQEALQALGSYNVREALLALAAPPERLLDAASRARSAAENRVFATQQLPADWTTAAEATRWAQALLGDDFRLTLRVAATALPTGYAAALQPDQRTQLLRHHAQNPLLLDEWLHGVARVRDAAYYLEQINLLSECVADVLPLTLTPAQLASPQQTTGAEAPYWLGAAFPATYQPLGDALSLVQILPASYSPTAPQRALWLDEWSEIIPVRTQDTAVVFHYDQPNTEAPQTLLLVVPPHAPSPATPWQWADLLGAVNETLDLAKKRAVEPDSLAYTPLGMLLPALVAPVAKQAVTMTLDFRRLVPAAGQTAQFPETPLLPGVQP